MTKEIFSIWLIPSDIDGGNISKSIQSLSKNPSERHLCVISIESFSRISSTLVVHFRNSCQVYLTFC